MERNIVQVQLMFKVDPDEFPDTTTFGDKLMLALEHFMLPQYASVAIQGINRSEIREIHKVRNIMTIPRSGLCPLCEGEGKILSPINTHIDHSDCTHFIKKEE